MRDDNDLNSPVSRRRAPREGRVGCGHREDLRTGRDNSDQPEMLDS